MGGGTPETIRARGWGENDEKVKGRFLVHKRADADEAYRGLKSIGEDSDDDDEEDEDDDDNDEASANNKGQQIDNSDFEILLEEYDDDNLGYGEEVNLCA